MVFLCSNAGTNADCRLLTNLFQSGPCFVSSGIITHLERRDGILQVTLHSNGDTLRWGGGPHGELGAAFRDLGSDPETKVIILTGTGPSFIEEVDSSNVGQRLPATQMSPQVWDHIYWNAKQLLMNFLEIEVPMIAAVNGPSVYSCGISRVL